jgi:hypothetical protein
MKQLFGSNLENSKFVNAGTATWAARPADRDLGADKKEQDVRRLTYYAAKSGKPYILKYPPSAARRQAGALTFSQYDQPVSPVVAPSGAIDLDTLLRRAERGVGQGSAFGR